MGTSTTIIAALKFESGVVIAADSQASDIHAGVRWPLEKLTRIKDYPLVIGFSGSSGMADRGRKALEATTFHQNMFKKRDLIRDAIDRCLNPVYQTIREKKLPPIPNLGEITLWGLASYWAEDAPPF